MTYDSNQRKFSKLSNLFDGLSVAEIDRTLEFVEALKRPVDEEIDSSSDIVDSKFADDFRSRILTSHVFQNTPLLQDAFEQAFLKSSRAAGHKAIPAPVGTRFWDVELNDDRVSLKSSKAASIREDYLHISKLTEAAWIQDCRSAQQREEETKNLFRQYLSNVNRIIQLRWFQKRSRYELIEIPVRLLGMIENVPRTAFASDGPSIHIPHEAETPLLVIKLDRSDAKITISRIRIDACQVHGRWTIPTEKD